MIAKYLSKLGFLLVVSLLDAATPSVSSTRYTGRAPISIDGDLSDWSALAAGATPILQACPLVAARTSQASFRLLGDSTYLYVAIDAPQALTGGSTGAPVRIADVSVYGGASLADLHYKKFRGVDGLLSLIYSETAGASIDGHVRIPDPADPGRYVDAPGIWDALGAKVAVRRQAAGFTAEVAIPLEVLGWSQSGAPAEPLSLNVRVYGRDKDGVGTAVQWIADPHGTSDYSHELLGSVIFSSTVASGAASSIASPSVAYAALQEMAKGDGKGAISTLSLAEDARLKPLLSLAMQQAGQAETAHALLQQMAAKSSPELRAWAARRLALTPEQVLLQDAAMPLTAERSIARLAAEAGRAVREKRLDEAMVTFRAVADHQFVPVRLRTWSLLQVQKIQQSQGKREDAIATGWTIQQTAPDGDVNRRVSLAMIVEAYYAADQVLVRSSSRAREHKPPETVYARLASVLKNRVDGVGCAQTLELGELMRAEGAVAKAPEQYLAATGMAGCPREDRAWALLLLQRAQTALLDHKSAIAAAGRIQSEYADEWDVRAESLREARSLNDAAGRTAYLGALDVFRRDLSGGKARLPAAEAALAKNLLEHLTPASPTAQFPIPDARAYEVYGYLFRYSDHLRRKAAENVASGHPETTIGRAIQTKARLNDAEASALGSIAADCVANMDRIAGRRRELISAIRAKEGPIGSSPPKPRPELAALQVERRQTVLASRDKLRQAFGEQRFFKLEHWLLNDELAPVGNPVYGIEPGLNVAAEVRPPILAR